MYPTSEVARARARLLINHRRIHAAYTARQLQRSLTHRKSNLYRRTEVGRTTVVKNRERLQHAVRLGTGPSLQVETWRPVYSNWVSPPPPTKKYSDFDIFRITAQIFIIIYPSPDFYNLYCRLLRQLSTFPIVFLFFFFYYLLDNYIL